VRAVRQRLIGLAAAAGVAGISAFVLGVWLSVHETVDSFSSGSGDLSSTGTTAAFQGPSTWSLIAQTSLDVVGIALVAVAVVAVAGVVATVVVDGARVPAGPTAVDDDPPSWPHEIAGNG
jgi:hypothetical protein